MSPGAPLRELRVVVGGPAREAPGDPRLDGLPALPEVPVQTLVAGLRAAPAAGAWTICAAEPALRPDLPRLIAALVAVGAPRPGLATDGLGLARPEALAPLREAGLQRLRLGLHGVSADGGFEAHDWLVGRPGAGRRVVAALRQALALGLEVEVEITLTRPTTPLLADTVRAALALGAHRLRLRRLTARGAAAGPGFVAVSPRLALAAPALEAAAELARAARRDLTLHGFPACALGPAADRLILAAQEPLWPGDDAAARALAPLATGRHGDCAACPTRRCDGAPDDYTRRFGFFELRAEDAQAPGARREDALTGPRRGRFPAARLADVRAQARGLEPLRPAPAPLPPRMSLALHHPLAMACPVCAGPDAATPSRAFRQRLVAAASHGVTSLDVVGVGSLHHPDLIELLRDALALGFDTIHASGDGEALSRAPLGRLRRLRPQDRLSLLLYGATAEAHDAHCGRPGAFAATLIALERLRASTPARVEAVAVVHRARELPAFDDAWSRGGLPGAPAWSLALHPGELDRLAEALPGLSPLTRAALAPLLPRCKVPGAEAPGAEAPGVDSPGVDSPGVDSPGVHGLAPLFDPAMPGGLGALPRPGACARTAFGPCPGPPACPDLKRCAGPAISWGCPPPSPTPP